MPKHPLAEVFGFRYDDMTAEAERYRQNKLCPFHNKSANCTKDKANNPLGVCSIFGRKERVDIVCPIRFRQDWMIATDAAEFFGFPQGEWTSLTEVRLSDKHGKSAGNIDAVVVRYDERGKVVDYGALEVQAVYISGNLRNPFAAYMADPAENYDVDWSRRPLYPTPDYLSSTRKRLAPQLIYKGGILHAWKRKIAVAMNTGLFETLPSIPEVAPSQAEMAWFVYDLQLDTQANRYVLTKKKTVYTAFLPALTKITQSDAGDESGFIGHLQIKLEQQNAELASQPPDTALIEFSLSGDESSDDS